MDSANSRLNNLESAYLLSVAILNISESSNSVKYTVNVYTPKNKITNSSFMTNTKCAENKHKL